MTQYNTRIQMKSDTTANWVAQRTFVPLAGEIIIYTDYETKTDDNGKTVNIPAIKIGDGSTYGVDLPFVNNSLRDQIMEHINNTDVHTTLAEKLFWNNKINVVDEQEVVDNTLIFVRN